MNSPERIDISGLPVQLIEAHDSLSRAMDYVDTFKDGAAWMVLYDARTKVDVTIATLVCSRYSLMASAAPGLRIVNG